MAQFTVAIMAGGKSSRMGTDKAFVRLNDKPLIEHVIGQVAGLGQHETILITNRPDAYAHLGLPMFGDLVQDKGALGGIHAALTHSAQPYVLVVACDTPFVKPELFRYMLTLLEGPFDVVVPRVKDYPQGLHAIYGKGCLSAIEERIAGDRLHVIGFYPKVRTRYLDETEYAPYDPTGVSFFNINTPQDLEQGVRIAAGEPYQPREGE